MSDLLDEFRGARATVRSSSGVVTVTQAGFGRPTVAIDVRKLTGHDEHTLAGEIEQVIVDARDTCAEQLREMAERHGYDGEPPRDNTIARHLPDLAPEIEKLEGHGTSERGHVVVGVFGDGDVVVEFQRNAVRRVDVDNAVLEPEVNNAITQATNDFGEQVRELIRQRVANARGVGR